MNRNDETLRSRLAIAEAERDGLRAAMPIVGKEITLLRAQLSTLAEALVGVDEIDSATFDRDRGWEPEDAGHFAVALAREIVRGSSGVPAQRDPLEGIERPEGCGPDGEPLPGLGPDLEQVNLRTRCTALEHLLEVWEREYPGASPAARQDNRWAAMADAVDDYRAIYPRRK